MLALLSSPVRRWLLATIGVPVLVWILTRAGRYLERCHDGRPTPLSRLLLKASHALQRLGERRDATGTAESEERVAEPA